MPQLLKMPRFLILLLLISLPPTSAMFFTSALPQLSRYFSLTQEQAQWTMSIFLIGFTLGLLIYGPMGNRFGRKKTIFLGLWISIIGSTMAFLSSNFSIFCLGRFIQALGASVGLKITFTMVGDLQTGKNVTKTLSYLLLGLAIIPYLGVTLGGFLSVAYSWRACFAFLVLYTFLLFLLCLTLPETAAQIDKKALHLKRVFHNYRLQFKDPFIIFHATLMGLTVATLYVFANEAPFIGMELMGLTAEEYGLFNILIPIGMTFGLFMGNRMAGKVAPRVAMLMGIMLVFIGTIAMTLCFFYDASIAWRLFIPQAVIQMGGVLLGLFASSKGLSEAQDKSNAAAVMQFINLSCGTTATLLFGAFAPESTFTLPIIFMIFASIMLLVWLNLQKHHIRSPL